MARALPRTKIANGQGGCVRPCIAPDGRGQSTPAPYGRKRSWRSGLARTLTESDHRHSCKRAFWRSHYTPTYSQVRAARVRTWPQTRAEGNWRLPTLAIPRQKNHLRPQTSAAARRLPRTLEGGHRRPRMATTVNTMRPPSCTTKEACGLPQVPPDAPRAPARPSAVMQSHGL